MTKRTVTVLERVSRYDLVLAVIPLAFVAALGVGELASLPIQTAVVTASALALLAVADALFVHPPE